MKIKTKRLIALLFALVIAVSVMPVSTANAEGEEWISIGNGWHYLQGTDIKVQIANDTIRITGSGALPDCNYWHLYKRPWHASGCHYLRIDSTITSIGQYNFYDIDTIKYVFLSSKTFIDAKNAFSGISYMPIFRIKYDGEETRMIGTIPYTSYDSIKAFAQSNSMGASYIMDNSKIAQAFQESVNPTICNVFSAEDTSAPWNSVADNGNGNVATQIIRLAPENHDYSYNVSAQIIYPGMACYEVYAAFIGDYTFATPVNVVVLKEGKKVEYTDAPMKYVLTIPPKYRQAGRSFRLLGIAPGAVNIYDDLDTLNETITFETNYPSTAYALVYKDNNVFNFNY